MSFDIIRAPLVVLLQEEDPKELADKPEELADYKGYIAYYNKQLQSLGPQYWKFSPSVAFRPESARKEIRAAKGKRTVLLRYDEYVSGASAGGYHSSYMGSRRVASMELATPSSGDENPDYRSPAPLDLLYPSDIVFALRNIQLVLERNMKRKAWLDAGRKRKDIEQEEMAEATAARQADAEFIRAKTLLIAETDLDDPKLTVEAIKEHYPYPFQLVPRATIEAAVQMGDTRHNYLRRMSESVEVIGQFIIDAATGQVLVVDNISGVGVGKKESLSKDTFERVTGIIKRNSR
jgi:hypothetical protein